MNVLDSSAILAYLLGEPGGATVRDLLGEDAACSAISWSEVAQKTRALGQSWQMSRVLLLGLGVTVMPVTATDAEAAAELWASHSSLSLADRTCIALGTRLGATIITCDREWGGLPGVRLVR